jgi:NAD(P)-dependent dehydrogenase (short-subunit alcohol dehydrogenase family)
MMPEQTFKDQVAVVTGAGEGIGFEIARRLAVQGAHVLLNDINSELAKQAARDICDEGGACVGVEGDIADVEVLRELAARAVSDFGRLTIAIANAGLSLWNDFFDFKPEDFHRILAVNLGG